MGTKSSRGDAGQFRGNGINILSGIVSPKRWRRGKRVLRGGGKQKDLFRKGEGPICNVY